MLVMSVLSVFFLFSQPSPSKPRTFMTQKGRCELEVSDGIRVLIVISNDSGHFVDTIPSGCTRYLSHIRESGASPATYHTAIDRITDINDSLSADTICRRPSFVISFVISIFARLVWQPFVNALYSWVLSHSL